MADDFAQNVKSLNKNGEGISVNDYQFPILVKEAGTGNYIIPEIGDNGGLKVDLVDASGIQVAVELDKAEDSVAIWSNTAKDGTGTAYQPIVDADGQLQVDVLDISKGTQTNDVKITLDGEQIVIDDISAGTQTNDVKVTMDGENINIGDISAGVQTNDVKVTMDGEDIVLDPSSQTKITDGTSVLDVAVEGDAIVNGVTIMGEDPSGNNKPIQVNSSGEIVVNIGADDFAFTRSSANLVKDTETTVVTRSPGADEKYSKIRVTGFGLCHWQIQFGVTASEATIVDVQTTPSNPNAEIDLKGLIVSSGETIRVRATNRENHASPASDFTGYATLIREL